MEMSSESIAKLVPYILAALSPVLVGFLRQMSEKVNDAPWYLKSLLNFVIGAAITYLTNLAGADANVAVGAGLAAIGSVNIAARKGVTA